MSSATKETTPPTPSPSFTFTSGTSSHPIPSIFPPGFTAETMGKLHHENQLFDLILFLIKCIFITVMIIFILDAYHPLAPKTIHVNFLVKYNSPIAKALGSTMPVYNPMDHSLSFDFTQHEEEVFIQNATNANLTLNLTT